MSTELERLNRKHLKVLEESMQFRSQSIDLKRSLAKSRIESQELASRVWIMEGEMTALMSELESTRKELEKERKLRRAILDANKKRSIKKRRNQRSVATAIDTVYL